MTVDVTTTFNFDAAWQLTSQVSLREESFGALAYHHVTRRLVFLKSLSLVALVQSLEHHASARAAIEAHIVVEKRPSYEVALASLARSDIIRER